MHLAANDRNRKLRFGALFLVCAILLAAFSQIRTTEGPQNEVLFQSTAQVVLHIGKEHDIALVGTQGERSGFSLGVGDIDTDGQVDMFIGVPSAFVDTNLRVGAAFGFLGPMDGRVSSVSGAAIKAKGFDFSAGVGSAIVVVDLNMDGETDLIVSASEMPPEPNHVEAGIIFVVLGPVPSGIVDVAERADFKIIGAARRHDSGRGLAAGDLNNDGVIDLAIGTPGAQNLTNGSVEILFVPFDGSEIDLRDGADVTLIGTNPGGEAGTAVAVGAVKSDPNGLEHAGEAYVVYGPLQPGAVDLASSAAITLRGQNNEDFSGSALAIGDLSGDGVSDLVIGSQGRLQADELGQARYSFCVGRYRMGRSICTTLPI